MQVNQEFDAGHEDLIHDLSYNYYGDRLITCSSDHKLKVFDKNANGVFVLHDSWKGHDSAVLRVSWAHPEFGQVFASCSFDRTIKYVLELNLEYGSRL